MSPFSHATAFACRMPRKQFRNSCRVRTASPPMGRIPSYKTGEMPLFYSGADSLATKSCMVFRCDLLDGVIAEEMLKALQPAELELALSAPFARTGSEPLCPPPWADPTARLAGSLSARLRRCPRLLGLLCQRTTAQSLRHADQSDTEPASPGSRTLQTTSPLYRARHSQQDQP
jgi:hypothetical protein